MAAHALRQHLEGQLAEGDPRRRLVALKMLHSDGDLVARRRARREIARLAAEAPDDPLVAFARTWFCGEPHERCTQDELDAWSLVEPDNAAAYLHGLASAADRGDAVAQDAVLRRMAAAPRQDGHVHTLALETVASFDDYVPPPASRREREVLRQAGFGDDAASRRAFMAAHFAWAMPYPNIGAVSRACRPPLPASRTRDCRTVLLRLSRATTMIERMVAFASLERLARGTPEAAVWAREVRKMRWWSSQFAQVLQGPDYWQDFVAHGEIGAMRRALLRTGRPLDPPDGWRPGLS